ncbi:multicopper oxidase domain-containing protein [Streptosporangium saharense]|uniref:multicopper oxidase domain-containing protein n=1 Tax=Streptosporangium saharense TaxID=1706840 RepID=UPI0036AE906D
MPDDTPSISRRTLLSGAAVVGVAGGYGLHAALTPGTAHAVHPLAGARAVAPVPRAPGAARVFVSTSAAGADILQLRPHRDRLRIPPKARPVRERGMSHLTVTMRAVTARLHADLPPTPLWAYDGHFPGPTIEVRRGERLRVTWVNALTGAYPLTAVQLPNAPGPAPVWDLPGRSGATPRADVAALPPWTVVHLHGAHIGGGHDGWAENAILPGGAQLTEYVNDQRSAALWYHDHAMHITRFNTMAGLTAGMYLIRDDEERGLGLPSGDREIPLVLCDRNFDTGSDGRVNGRLLHKIAEYPQQAETVVRSFTGPYTLVNGTVWPYTEVGATWYRFRILNAASIRPYLLRLVDEEGQPVTGRVFQIGTDAGLLPAPVPIDDWVLTVPAERADVLVDFTGLGGRTLRWVDASFIASPVPEVLAFRVREERRPPRFTPPARISRDFEAVDPAALPEHPQRLVLVTPAFPINAELWEMERVEQPPAGPLPIDGIVQFEDQQGRVTTYRRLARDYSDPVAFHVNEGDWETWRFVSLEGSGVPHPMHTHGFSFQAVERLRVDGSTFRYFTTPSGRLGGGTETPIKVLGPGTLRPEERGWKDVIALGFEEMITTVGRFTGSVGRFMHHCHVYEHEDHKMMRPFVVLPKQVMAMDPHAPGHGH